MAKITNKYREKAQPVNPDKLLSCINEVSSVHPIRILKLLIEVVGRLFESLITWLLKELTLLRVRFENLKLMS